MFVGPVLPFEVERGWLFVLADMPFVNPSTLEMILSKTLDNQIVRPKFHNQPGNPVYISKIFRSKLEKLSGDKGARGLITSVPSDLVLTLRVDDLGVVQDIDTPIDLPIQ